MNWGQIKALIRTKLQDSSGRIWTDNDLLGFGNEGLRDLTTGAEATIKKAYFSLQDGVRTYRLPSGCFELKGVRVNGNRVYGSTNARLQELDLTYLTSEGTPEWFYLEDIQTLAFYPVPSWVGDYETFDADLGATIELDSDGTLADFSSDLGVVTSLLDTTSAKTFVFSELEGVWIAADNNGLTCEITYVYVPDRVVSDSDVPDLPEFMHYALSDFVLRECFSRPGRGFNEFLAGHFGRKYAEQRVEWFSRSRPLARGEAQMFSQKPVGWGSDLRWRERVWP